jgi:acyl transferase domain-containing protein
MAQPLCTALQIALVNSLARRGVKPNAVIGHSSGEIAAAYATGALSMSEAIIIAYYRGYVTKKPTSLRGGMAAIGLDKSSTSAYLTDKVVIACENSPNSMTISGDLHEVESIIKRIKEGRPDVLASQLKVDMAYHSRTYSITQ